MAIAVSGRSSQYGSGTQKRSGTGALYNKSKAAGDVIDTADSYQKKFNKNGTVTTLADQDNVGTMVNGTRSIGAGVRKIAQQALTGDALHAAVFGWANPEAGAILILRVIVDITTVATAACTLDIGITASSATTSSDTLLDGIDVNTAIGVFDSMNSLLDSAANAKAQKLASGKWITFDEKTGDATGLVGTAYIEYVIC